MRGFRGFAIVSGFSFWEVGDGEAESTRIARGFGRGAGSIGRVAAEETAQVADSRSPLGNGRRTGCEVRCAPDRSVAEARLLFVKEAGRCGSSPRDERFGVCRIAVGSRPGSRMRD